MDFGRRRFFARIFTRRRSSELRCFGKTGRGRYFVIEADEYDSAFFDKRPKFLHYHPTVAVLNNLEFDHADIYDSIDEITKQFHYLMRTIPEDGQVLVRLGDDNLKACHKTGAFIHRF